LQGRERTLMCLWEFVRERGHARPAAAYVAGDGFKLGRWVAYRRASRGRDPALDALLEPLPGWTWSVRSVLRGAVAAIRGREELWWAERRSGVAWLVGAPVAIRGLRRAFKAPRRASGAKGRASEGPVRTRRAESVTRQREVQSISDERGEGHG
jgi:hypothetical protein